MPKQAYQSNFTQGEISPQLDGRVDIAKYYNGCARLENLIILPQGGAQKRPGTRFVAEVKDSTTKVRPVRFEYSREQAYVLEFGQFYVRFFKDGGQIMIGATIDYYEEGNYNTFYILANGQKTSLGQSITGLGLTLNSAKFYLKKFGAPTGNAVAKLYAHSGVWGSTGVPTGAALATSANLDVATLSTMEYQLIELTFAAPYTPVNGTHYCLVLEYSGGDAQNFIQVAADNSSPTHPGNLCYYSGGTWGYSTRDLIFYALSTGGTPYEIATPWSEKEVGELCFTQSADVLYIAHSDYPPKRLIRKTHTDWRLLDVYFEDYPSEIDRLYPAATLTPGAVSGTGVTFTAGAAVFLKGDEQKYLYYPDGIARAKIVTYTDTTHVVCDIIDPFPSTAAIPANSWYMAGSCLGAEIKMDCKAGDGSLIFGEGVSSALVGLDPVFRASDMDKIFRAFDGVMRISAFTDTTHATAVILREIIKETTAWRRFTMALEIPAWGAMEGGATRANWPGQVCFFNNRLVFARSWRNQQGLWGSRVGKFEDFILGSKDDDAFAFTLASNEANYIQWLAPLKHLFVGTIGGEWRFFGAGDVPLGPTNVQAKMETAHGAAALPPLVVGSAVIYLQRQQQALREIRYNYEIDAYESATANLNLLAQHICKPGLADLAYAREPYSIIWAPRTDGVLLSLTYLPQHEDNAWARHLTDGEVERACTLPGENETEVWLVVKRTINGVMKRYIEIMVPNDYGEELKDAWFVDCGLQYVGAPATLLSGLDHLKGKTVAVFADGLQQASKVVNDSGQITLDTAASQVQVGLPYTAKLQTMRLNLPGDNQQGYTKRVHEVVVRLHRTVGGKLGPDADRLEAINPGGAAEFTGDKPVKYRGGWETDAKVYLEHSDPTPCTVLAVMPRFVQGEK